MTKHARFIPLNWIKAKLNGDKVFRHQAFLMAQRFAAMEQPTPHGLLSHEVAVETLFDSLLKDHILPCYIAGEPVFDCTARIARAGLPEV